MLKNKLPQKHLSKTNNPYIWEISCLNMPLKKLEMNENGKLTLEGRVVDAKPIGPPILGPSEAKIEDHDIVFQTGELPSIDSSDYHLIKDADAYLLSSREVLCVEHERRFNRVWTKVWKAVQFYKITGK